MKYIIIILLVAGLSSCNGQQDRLIWSDEFDYEGRPDPERWSFQTGDGCPELCGWGNNELQYYTDDLQNAQVADGKLIIEALRHEESPVYTSAKLISKEKGDWRYGYIEVRAKLPYGRGTWPAIWMLPTLGRPMLWPADGEIDIMEHVGYNQGTVYGTIHTEKYNHRKGTQQSDSIKVEDAHSAFHTYAIEWTPEHIKWFVDGENYHTFNRNNEQKEGWPFDEPFHLILNLAVGGDWGGKYGVDDSIWPQRLEIDYVRVFKAE